MTDNVPPLLFGRRTVEFVSGSIVQLPEKYGTLVSPDDIYLSHSDGISQQLWSAAGPALSEEIERRPPTLSLGDIHATTAGNLNADWLLHAATFDYDIDKALLCASSSSAFMRSALITAEKLGCSSIAIPSWVTGAAGLSKDNVDWAVGAFANAIEVWAAGPSALLRIALVALPVDSAFLIKCREQLAPIVSAEKLVASLRPPFLEPGKEWLGLCKTRVDIRFYRAATLLEETMAVAVRELGFDALSKRESEWQVIWQVGEKVGAKAALPLTEVWTLRNQMAHRAGIGEMSEAEALGPVNLAMFALLSLFAGSKLDQVARMVLHNLRNKKLHSAPFTLELSAVDGTGEAACSALAPTALGLRTENPVGNEPVRQLRAFVDQTLKGRYREHFFQNLASSEYAGPDELRLLEFLIRVPDPAVWLSNNFGCSVLQRELRKRGRTPTTDDCHELSLQLLESMGFPIARKFKCIEDVTQDLGNIKNEMIVPHATFDGGVTRGARLLEYVCHVLIRFLAHAAFNRAPDILLRSSGKLAGDEELRACALGKLLELLQHMSCQIENDTDTVSVQRFKNVLQRAAPLPTNMQQLAAVRNSFAHYKGEAEEAEAVRCKRAQTFITDAITFTESVNGGGFGLFPIIVRIDSITVDRWGRRTVVAFRGDGKRETIFTSQPLSPGQVYFMHPTTNPLRVDPLLVQAGKLWDERDQQSP